MNLSLTYERPDKKLRRLHINSITSNCARETFNTRGISIGTQRDYLSDFAYLLEDNGLSMDSLNSLSIDHRGETYGFTGEDTGEIYVGHLIRVGERHNSDIAGSVLLCETPYTSDLFTEIAYFGLDENLEEGLERLLKPFNEFLGFPQREYTRRVRFERDY